MTSVVTQHLRSPRFNGWEVTAEEPTPASLRERIHDPGSLHDEHVTHMHESHGGGIECSCGRTLGVVCFVPCFDEGWVPAPCGDCLYWRRKRLRGIVTGLVALKNKRSDA